MDDAGSSDSGGSFAGRQQLRERANNQHHRILQATVVFFGILCVGLVVACFALSTTYIAQDIENADWWQNIGDSRTEASFLALEASMLSQSLMLPTTNARRAALITHHRDALKHVTEQLELHFQPLFLQTRRFDSILSSQYSVETYIDNPGSRATLQQGQQSLRDIGLSLISDGQVSLIFLSHSPLRVLQEGLHWLYGFPVLMPLYALL
mgnify:FL=1